MSRWIASCFQLIKDASIIDVNTKEKLWSKIYPQNAEGIPVYNPSGKYWVKLYFQGKSKKVEVDDQFLYFNGQPVFPRCTNQNLLWPMLFTKALIRLQKYFPKAAKTGTTSCWRTTTTATASCSTRSRGCCPSCSRSRTSTSTSSNRSGRSSRTRSTRPRTPSSPFSSTFLIEASRTTTSRASSARNCLKSARRTSSSPRRSRSSSPTPARRRRSRRTRMRTRCFYNRRRRSRTTW